MIILQRLSTSDGQPSRQVIALFGMGLIGRSITASVTRRLPLNIRELPFSWGNPDQRSVDARAIEKCILSSSGPNMREQAPRLGRIDFVWAAGQAGFGATQPDVERELDAFKDVVELSKLIQRRVPQVHHSFHLLSSAGGLFEGQCQVSSTTAPHPRRPYGMLKLEQERHLIASCPGADKLIYRPTSVYGFSGSGLRVGLVNALVQNAIRHQVSRIYGEPHTLRDYVLAADIGSFVTERLLTASRGSETFLLASGKPSSMFEVLRKVEHAIGRRLYLQFNSEPSNASHMSFCIGALPQGWRPTDLDTGVRQTALQLLGSFARRR